MARRATRNPDIELTAYHEAAHAVVALHYGWEIHDVNVFFGRPGYGFVRYRVPRSLRSIQWTGRSVDALPYWQQSLMLSKNYGRILLAGPIAEAMIMATPMRSLGAISDLKKVRDLLRQLDLLREILTCHTVISEHYRAKFFPKLQHQTKQLLRSPTIWKSVQVLADDLCRWKTLTGHDVANTVQWVRTQSGQLSFQFSEYQNIMSNEADRSIRVQPSYHLQTGRAVQ